MTSYRTKQAIFALMAMPLLALSVVGITGGSAYAAADNCSITGGISAAADCTKSNDQPTDLFGNGGIFQKVSDVLLFVIGAVSVIMLILGGIKYTISQGDSSAVTSAKNTILYAIIGLVVAILAYAAVHFVIGNFAGNSNNAV